MIPIPIVMGLAQIAPTLLRYLGVGEKPAAVMDKVVEVAQIITGTQTPDAALSALKVSPDLQLQFQQKVLEIDSQLEALYLADRQDARARDVALAKLGHHNRRADVMVLLDVIGLVACLVVLAFFRKDIPNEVVGLLTTIASIFGLCLRDAHQFEFGSSRGSREKDVQLADLVKGN